MKKSDFNYNLPEELIAQNPLEHREESRLLVLNRKNNTIEHKGFKNFINFLNKGDALVLNNTRVIPARIFGSRRDKNEKIEVLLIKRLNKDTWETLVKPGKKLKIDTEIIFSEKLSGVVTDISEDGSRYIKFNYNGVFEEILDELGEMPLPPYITEKLDDKERYQTVYSKEKGSAAAPTAGLHFTKEILEEIEKKGIKIFYITLHVGIGTFRPVKVDDIKDHHMHSEYFSIDEATASELNFIKSKGGRVISVGTTTTRTLESMAESEGLIKSGSGWTDIFIYPGYDFKFVDCLLTNFHLPESTLLMLVSAFANKEIILEAYEEAIKERYRFFSFGDAMYIC